MTIIVAGYDGKPDFSTHRLLVKYLEEREWTDDDEAIAKAEERSAYQSSLENPDRAYAYADSRLSRDQQEGRVVVTDSAQKLAKIDLVLSKPYFMPHGRPSSTQSIVVQQTSCGVGYSGEAQMHHLVLDKFRELARSVRYTWVSGNPGRYGICLAGAKEDLAHPSHDKIEYDESIDFNFNELPPLEADFVADMFDRSFVEVLKEFVTNEQANRKSDQPRPVQYEAVLLTYCHARKKPLIYQFGYEPDTDTFPSSFRSIRKALAPEELAVLGKPSWSPGLELARNDAIIGMDSVQRRMLVAVERKIAEDVNQNYVGGPVLRGTLNEYGFSIAAP